MVLSVFLYIDFFPAAAARLSGFIRLSRRLTIRKTTRNARASKQTAQEIATIRAGDARQAHAGAVAPQCAGGTRSIIDACRVVIRV
ncbi:hypothetical protein [Burkholderia pseudomultivorans]|uniref:hypothetical protein n=1 Tax=Burkholderia pseudomultivorans TaxID=1207504 RepID=UPI0012DB3EB7|nr:hypothetical protein [Burkholderia pseudomultivorans]